MHAFALFHDDVMDDAESRRGERDDIACSPPTRSRRWTGEARRFGDGMAILIGDLAFVYSDQLMARRNATAWRIWNELRIELNVGQVLDMLGSGTASATSPKAERICRYKSGKYTIERPFHLGAALAARFDDASGLSCYGLPWRRAQMRDDVMGRLGDERTTGKPVGGDLREGEAHAPAGGALAVRRPPT